MLTPYKSDISAGHFGPDGWGATEKLYISAGYYRPDGWQTTEKSAFYEKRLSESWERHKTVMFKTLRMGRRGFGHASERRQSPF